MRNIRKDDVDSLLKIWLVLVHSSVLILTVVKIHSTNWLNTNINIVILILNVRKDRFHIIVILYHFENYRLYNISTPIFYFATSITQLPTDQQNCTNLLPTSFVSTFQTQIGPTNLKIVILGSILDLVAQLEETKQSNTSKRH